ncbi:cytochrome b ascorbate-dependent protein 3 [Sinocyclocheilus grahami]|uniref:cytochrome b ascorbate-dependent protein 3 n=1 Tax=Sinocyclocheilus grahami TaxID=75366 RepID=UPI0007AC7270|nr:PREDICTED: cytochrome b ascorbate-dependent protein 3-like [Sinocyclocheilus grahami]
MGNENAKVNVMNRSSRNVRAFISQEKLDVEAFITKYEGMMDTLLPHSAMKKFFFRPDVPSCRILISENAIVLYRVPLKWSRWWCKLTHGGLLFVAVVLSVLGVRAAFDFHTANNIPHLYSLHSWTGISTVALFTLQWFVGLCAFLLPWTPLAVRACLKPLHIWMGIAIFTLSLITSLSGINEKLLLTLNGKNGSNTEPYTALPAEALFANSLGILVVIFGLLVLKILSNQKWKNPEFENETDRPLLTDAR